MKDINDFGALVPVENFNFGDLYPMKNIGLISKKCTKS